MSMIKELGMPDVLSLLNAIFGFAALACALGGRHIAAVSMILLAAACDGIDGLMARRMAPSDLGVNLDSMADLISFGIAPAFLSYAIFGQDVQSLVLFAAGSIYVGCGMLRLARFNVSPKHPNLFEGLPITAAGVTLAAGTLVQQTPFIILLTLLLSALMVSSMPYPKVQDPRFVPAALLVFVTAVAVGLYTGSTRYAGLVILLSLVPYILSPVVIPFIRKER